MTRKHLSEEARRELVAAQLERCNNPALADVVEKNIGMILKMRLDESSGKSMQEKVADAITTFSGTMAFVYVHAAFFAIWIIINTTPILHMKQVPDPFPFNFLTMTVSLEAIFLATFVLISQNRMGAAADKRADLDLQINLLAEHEVTRLLILVDAIATKLGIDGVQDPDCKDLEKDGSATDVLKELADREKEIQ